MKFKGHSYIEDCERETPKFLSDIFESVAGAIYLDSDCCLTAVWNAYYKILEPYLGKKIFKF